MLLMSILVLLSWGGIAALHWHSRQEKRKLLDELGSLTSRCADYELAISRLQEHEVDLDKMAREQLAVEVVLGNLLVEKGIINEEEIEEAHLRLVVEPARINEEHEALLCDIPDRDAVRARMIRNVPLILH